MKATLRILAASFATSLLFITLQAQTSSFHNAPASAKALKNPFAGNAGAAKTGKALFASTCASCHGASGQGTGSVPPLTKGPVQTANPGEVFWFITHGDVSDGMPAWESLPEEKRWQIVTFVKTLGSHGQKPAVIAKTETAPGKLNTPPPIPPFTDFRFEAPGKVRKITAQDLPQPFATHSSGNGANVVPRPEGAWPKVLPGFKVEQYAVGLENPRLIRTAPNGDFFVAEMEPGRIIVFRGITSQGKAQQM
ncbi:MAG TPA: cytochrome c, partial [Bryobacteraceae bacterium]|nr:cytochrome c [Bryobacteraceae bacterium]